MASEIPPFGFFDPDMLAVLEKSFSAAWPVLVAHEPSIDCEKTVELKRDLSQMLVTLVAEGVTDAEGLRNLALQRLPLTPREPAALKSIQD